MPSRGVAINDSILGASQGRHRVKIECVLQCGNHLGEGPVWDVESGCLYWLDGTGRRVGNPSIWWLDPRTGKTRNWSFAHDVGAMALRRGGGAVLTMTVSSLTSRAASSISSLTSSPISRARVNDGKCDRRGRFFAGAGRQRGAEDLRPLPPGSGSRISKVDEGIICTNGPCWSRTTGPSILPTRFSTMLGVRLRHRGHALNKRVFASFKNDGGVADGSTIDEDGCLERAAHRRRSRPLRA